VASNRFFSVKYGGTLDSDVTESAGGTAADWLELRIDESQPTGNNAPSLDDIRVGLKRILKRLQEDQRYG